MESIESIEKGVETAVENIERGAGTAGAVNEAAGVPARGAGCPGDAAPEGGAAPAGSRRAAAARIGLLLGERGLSPYRFAMKAGISRQTVAGWLHGSRRPGAVTLRKAAAALGVSVAWLLTGRGAGPAAGEDGGVEEVRAAGGRACVSEYEAAPEGGGRAALRKVEDGEEASYRRRDLCLRRLEPAKCRRIRARGDGMEPLVRDGDLVLVDASDRGVRVRDGGIYCLDYGIGPRVRKLSGTKDGGLVMKCLNPAYADEALSAEEAAQRVRIYGRVVERSGWI